MTTFGPKREHPRHQKTLSYKGFPIDFFRSK